LTRSHGIRAALLGALLVLLAGACCKAHGGTCAAAQAAKKNRPHSAEFIFSNLCDETMVVRTVEVTAGEITLVHPREKTGEDGNEAGAIIAYGDEIFLGEGYFTPGKYRLEGKVSAVGKDDPDAALELGFEVVMELWGPVTVEISLGREGDACAVKADITSGADGGGRCYEPAHEAASVDCGP
jgi:hypothetical protein